MSTLVGTPSSALRRLLVPIEQKMASRGLAYPWWIPAMSGLCEFTVAFIALAQRDAFSPPRPVLAVIALIALSHVVVFTTPPWLGWRADIVVIVTASAWLLLTPTHYAVPADTAPMLLMVLAAVVTGRDGVLPGLVVTVASIGLLFAVQHTAGLSSPGLYSLEVVLGTAVGFMLLSQMRALTAEREARVLEHERATLEERQRIAREIHDLVAHSLSVTLLQVAGAREALRDGDLGDAVAALEDAESVGRKAMADIRSTVSTLRANTGDLRPLPGASEVPALVEQFAAAGLDVAYRGVGDPGKLGGAAGLGIFRVAQEALANVAKHVPTASARVDLEVTASRARLVVTNNVPGVLAPSSDGAGLPGMSARADGIGATLFAGPYAEGWKVEMVLPLGTRCGVWNAYRPMGAQS